MIKVENLTKKFNDHEVLKDINLTVEKGKIVIILGRSGSGKTVLMKCVAGLLMPDKGEITVDNIRVFPRNKHSKDVFHKIGFVFQGNALLDSLTVEQNITLGLRERGVKKEKAHEMAIEAIESVGLDSKVLNLYPSELSGGMKKMVAIARSLVLSPSYIIYDEPTTGLDIHSAKNIKELVLKFNREKGITTIVITHDLPFAYSLADKVYFLKGGRLLLPSRKEIEKLYE